MTKPFVPQVVRELPPVEQYSPVISVCPVCQRMAFGIVATVPARLAGQKARSRLAGVECPWCLHVTMYGEDGKKGQVTPIPLDHAAQFRARLAEELAAPETEAEDGKAEA